MIGQMGLYRRIRPGAEYWNLKKAIGTGQKKGTNQEKDKNQEKGGIKKFKRKKGNPGGEFC